MLRAKYGGDEKSPEAVVQSEPSSPHKATALPQGTEIQVIGFPYLEPNRDHKTLPRLEGLTKLKQIHRPLVL